MSHPRVNIHDKPLPQEIYVVPLEQKDEQRSYLNEIALDIDDTCCDDDFDVEVKIYSPPPPFKEFVKTPFHHLNSYLKTVMCKTGSIRLPKKIIDIYICEYGWNFENYHCMELIALLYLHYYRRCDEWREQLALEAQIADILVALPHFKNIGELMSYAYASGDLKLGDFEQVIEVDEHGVEDVTGRVLD